MSAPIVEMVDIRKQFGSVIALAGVSLSLQAGECHCLLGDNGAGKSTFIKTLSGVHQPSSGEIRVDAKPVQFKNRCWNCHCVSRSRDDTAYVGGAKFLDGQRASETCRSV